MTVYYIDVEDGSNYNGGTSFAVLVSGIDGLFNDTLNFNSAASVFTPDLVGHFICIQSIRYGTLWAEITAFVDEHNLTLAPRGYNEVWQVEGNMTFTIGGRWKDGADDERTVLIRVPLVNEDTAVQGPDEGTETFTLTATSNKANRRGVATAYLVEDDSGLSYPGTVTNGIVDILTGAGHLIKVLAHGPVNESSTYAYFTVIGSGVGQTLNLWVSQDTSSLAAAPIEFSYDETTWTTYSAGSKPLTPANKTVKVRVTLAAEADTAAEGTEGFFLNASDVLNAEVNGFAYLYLLDDDGLINVTAFGPVNEGSTYAPFLVQSTVGRVLDLALVPGSAVLPLETVIDFSYNGTDWATYATTNRPTVPAGGVVYVRVDIAPERDADFEGGQTFSLKVSDANNLAITASASTGIVDDGTGYRYLGDFSDGAPASSITSLDDDQTLRIRPLSVFNEDSPYAMFRMTMRAGESVTLQLGNTADLTDSDANIFLPPEFTQKFSFDVSTDGGASWFAYSSPVSVSAATSLPTTFSNEDEFRLIASPAPYPIGDAIWSNTVGYVDLPVAVAQDIDQCIVNWTVANSARLDATYQVHPRRISTGTNTTSDSSRFRFPFSSVAGNTKYWYKTLAAPLDLSAWTRICLWRLYGHEQGNLYLNLCSDTAGDTILATLEIPPRTGAFSAWEPLVLDFGGPLPSNVQSIALYSGPVSPAINTIFWLTNMIAVKPAGDPLEFTFSHLLAKGHAQAWAAATAYAQGQIRKPTTTQRTGFRYKVTVAGTSGGTEPQWPIEEGVTVQDGSVTWEPDGPEDTWHGCLALTGGTRFWIDHGEYVRNAYTSASGYPLFTTPETVASYLRRPSSKRGGMKVIPGNAVSYQTQQKMSGGWRRTDMAVVEEETWLDGEQYYGNGVSVSAYVTIENINAVRYWFGVAPYQTWHDSVLVRNSHFNCNFIGVVPSLQMRLEGVTASFNNSKALGAPPSVTHLIEPYAMVDMYRCSFDNNLAENWVKWPTYADSATVIGARYAVPVFGQRHRYVWARGNYRANSTSQHNFALAPTTPGAVRCEKFRSYEVASGNREISGRLRSTIPWEYSGMGGQYVFDDFRFHEGASYWLPEIVKGTAPGATQLRFINHRGVPGAHKILRQGFVIESETGEHRHTLAGTAWKIYQTSEAEYVCRDYPAMLPPFKVPMKAGEATTIAIWAKYVSNYPSQVVRLFCRGGQIAGIPDDVWAEHDAGPNVYQQLSITVTASVVGVIEVEAHTYRRTGGTTETPTVYFDDFSF